MDDFELLQSYALRKTEDAFRLLTERYVNLVYSAAARQMGNSDAAKDVTQDDFPQNRSGWMAVAHDALRRRQRSPARTAPGTLRTTSHGILRSICRLRLAAYRAAAGRGSGKFGRARPRCHHLALLRTDAT